MYSFLKQSIFPAVDDLGTHLIKLVNSGLYFAITFIILHYIGHAWSTANAWHYGYSPLFSYNGMDSLLGTTGWTARRTGIIHLMPPFVGFLGLVIGLISFHSISIRKTQARTFSFWLAFNGLLVYISYLVTGVLSGLSFSSEYFTGFVGFYAWLYWKDATIYGMLVLQFILCLPVIFMLSRMCLKLGYSKVSMKNAEGKIAAWINGIILPVVLGIIIIMAATFPMDFSFQAARIVTIVPIAGLLLFGLLLQSSNNINPLKGGIKPLPKTFIILGVAAIIFFSRTVLSLRIEPLW